MPTTLDEIREFLAQRRIALVGLSRDPKDFSRMLFRELSGRGYEMLPVNPAAAELEGQRCFARIQDIDPPAEAALLMTTPRETERVVRDCAEAGVRRVWMHSGGGQGAVSKEAVEFCRQRGMFLVEGHCPFMFLPSTPFWHRLHAWILKAVGRYPAPCAQSAAHRV